MPLIVDDILVGTTAVSALLKTLNLKGGTQHVTGDEAIMIGQQYATNVLPSFTVTDLEQISPTYLPSLIALMSSGTWWSNQNQSWWWMLQNAIDANASLVEPEPRVFHGLRIHAMWVAVNVDKATFADSFTKNMQATTNELQKYGGPVVIGSKPAVIQELTHPISIAGFDIPTWLVVGLVGGAAYLFIQHGGK
jgi:hypothetical protein